ncbi:MAG TPA: hypothetical protein VKX28_29535 [Xanthobacteraceae bacterium]|nr:hypothetical protein [Xanthobacteraceae bacterium]
MSSTQAQPRSAADWLALAAAPTFAVMALLTGFFGGTPDALCAAMQGTSPLTGMLPMYLLMSAFHAAPWVRLVSALSPLGIGRRRQNRHCARGCRDTSPVV